MGELRERDGSVFEGLRNNGQRTVKSNFNVRDGPGGKKSVRDGGQRDRRLRRIKKASKGALAPLKNLEYETFLFGSMRQSDGQSIDEFYVRLFAASTKCEFGGERDNQIKRQIIAGCKSTKLKESILANPGKTLARSVGNVAKMPTSGFSTNIHLSLMIKSES